MSEKQPEALRLAAQLEDPINAKLHLAPYIATELRRLYAENAQLRAEMESAYQRGCRDGMVKGREELAAEYPLDRAMYDSKDWRCGTYSERVEWLRTMYDNAKEQISEMERQQTDLEPYIWYDPENGQTWAPDAIAEGYTTDGLIPLYAAPQPQGGQGWVVLSKGAV